MATCVLVLVTTTARECHHTAARIVGTWRHHHLQGHSEGGEGRVMAAPPRSRLAKVACAWLLLVCCLASTGDWLPLVTR